MAKIFSFPNRSKSSVGIELGGNSIKMVETRKAGSGIELLSYGIVDIPDDKKGKSERDIPAISALVRKLLTLCKYPFPELYFSISGSSVGFQRLKLPPLPEKEILPAIMWEAKKLFPFSLKESRVLYKKTGIPSSDSDEIDLLVAAALNRFVSGELSVFQQIGINPAGIDTVFSAIQHAFKNSFVNSICQTTAFLDIEAQKTILSIFKEGTLLFSREIMPGGNDFTRVLMEPFSVGKKRFSLGFAEAEEIKTRYGIPMGKDQGKTPQGIPLSRIMFMMRPVLEKLITEALRSFDFFKANTREKSIDRVLLCSGGAGLKNLSESLSSGLGIEVSIFNPFENIKISPEIQSDENFLKNRHRLSVAVGLSTGKATDFNFLPPQPGILETSSLRKWIPLFSFILLVFTLFTFQSRLNRYVQSFQKELEQRQTELASLNVSIDELSSLTEKRILLKKQLSKFPDFSIKQPPFPDIFVSLTRVFPDSVSLKSIIMEKRKTSAQDGLAGQPDIKLMIEGIAVGNDYEVFNLLARVSRDLEKTPFFQNVMLDASERASDSGQTSMRFILKCPLKPDCFI